MNTRGANKRLRTGEGAKEWAIEMVELQPCAVGGLERGFSGKDSRLVELSNLVDEQDEIGLGPSSHNQKGYLSTVSRSPQGRRHLVLSRST